MINSEAVLTLGRVCVRTDLGTVSFGGTEQISHSKTQFENDFAKFTVEIKCKAKKMAYKILRIACKRDMILYDVKFCIPTPQDRTEFVFYKTFINAPAAAFVRCGERGFYTGIENPFFTACEEDGEIVISYQPSLILKAGEEYESDPQFIGEYAMSGVFVQGQEALNIEGMQSGRMRQRFFNPCDGVALDLSEIRAMRAYVWEYLNVMEREFDNILYFFFYPKKQYPQTDVEIADYFDTIDRFHSLKGNIIAFNPHTKTTLPTEEKPYWELLPQGSAAQKIFDHAVQKGLRCGYYMGCAFNGEGGNAALLPFMPHKTEWKKKDIFGNVASENCLACDEYLDWWYMVQANTISKYDLGYWAWDPGPGNGNDCYAENHGHLPGKGEYKGWRNSQKLLQRIRERFPRLFLQSFYGRKEYGFWGFRYFSQQEVYWEQTLLPGATLHSDFDDYRINAHGTRLQNLWSMNYRFLPPHIGHGLVTRMGEMFFDPALEKANDLIGWKYSLLSAIACCGSITHCNLPDRLENVPGMTAFYDKWIDWAKQNYRFCEYVTPLSNNVEDGTIDGFARIDGESGQIFLFNSSPLNIKKRVVLDQKIGIETDDAFYLRVLYCENADFENDLVDYGTAYKKGDVLDVVMPPYGALVLEMTDTKGERHIAELPSYGHKIDRFYGADGSVLTPMEHASFEKITVSASARFNGALKEVLQAVPIPNKALILEKMGEWREQKLPFNLLAAVPNRLLAYLPFAGVSMPREVSLRINGVRVPLETFYLKNIPFVRYAYIEDYVLWDDANEIELEIDGLAQNSFLGMYIGYPECCNGVEAERFVMDELAPASRLHSDDRLTIESLEVTPDIISDTDCEYTVTVKTDVPCEQIEAVYCILPTKPSMPALSYNAELNVWQGTFRTGNRRLNIFLRREMIAWIKSRDGGIGPQASCEIKTRYVYRK